ncbi:Ribonuclease III [Lasiodiplodia theobromae]|uniref:Ribonuclease III n=1 Tax=Lasiodiplodia theobromae TaxID=45133 RepID=UPI0015C3FC70|nr:Ribonuclease III [Lasiodiplodia theobromae]KAF4534683.1 Ribonuclease III [Lasiodiplodia theobromae]
MPMDTSETQATTAETGNKKNSRARRGRPPNSSLHQRLIEEELKKLNGFSGSSRGDLQALLDHPQILELSTNSSCVGQLRLLYLGIGSCQSLIQFKESLRVARTRSNTSVHAIGPNLLPKERFREICLYDDQEALSVLARRYHVAKLFETELENLRQDNAIIVETAADFGTNHTPQAGNPAMIQEAALTDRLLEKVAPDVMTGTTEFKRVRDRLSQMRRLAKRLQLLIKTYGFGILALLPCGPSYSDFTITDCTLISIPEAVFAQFSELLYQHQGMVLAELSKAVEPALTALADGTLESETLFPIEFAGVRDFEVLPMGSQEVLSICVCGALASL